MNILLAEDHNIVRNGIKMLLEADPDIKITGEAVDGAAVLDLLENNDHQHDIVLSDINMPLIDGISLITEIRNRGLKAKVMILSMHDNERYVHEAFKDGTCAYLMKSVGEEELIYAIKHIHAANFASLL